ncbi:group II intron reverse transcriptase/maturase [Candidatus Phytoplasma australasiaticum]|uniref:group II intron reverse transcriptase/maturase n=1 Tax=Candidatus Phytoplasma australasiaticum TaxID=2754999 RepID=UPI002A4E15E5|nr:group II intron reverse transcriptase/maturase [Sweet potato little leaf phytoplasma]
MNGRVNILITRETVRKYTNNYGWKKGEKIVPDQTLAHREPLEIIKTYKTIVRGIIQYFCMARNLSQLTYLNYIAEYSCLKTLAGK